LSLKVKTTLKAFVFAISEPLISLENAAAQVSYEPTFQSQQLDEVQGELRKNLDWGKCHLGIVN
jgi:hypothetical protein